jgi:hypothetical protein
VRGRGHDQPLVRLFDRVDGDVAEHDSRRTGENADHTGAEVVAADDDEGAAVSRSLVRLEVGDNGSLGKRGKRREQNEN